MRGGVRSSLRAKTGGFALVALLTAGATAWGEEAPELAVRAAFARYDEGWRRSDPETILAAMAPDFAWTNSVGLRFTERERFRRFLRGVFSDADYKSGEAGPTTIRAVRLLSPDVAVVEAREVTLGQRDGRTHKVVPEQDTNELTVFQRQGGRWLIVCDLTSDESHGI